MLIAKNLTRRYGQVLALDDASFRVDAGQVLALLGPNGAGKSTAMKLITGMLVPDSGSCELDGENVHDNPLHARRITGWLPEEAPLYPDMEVLDYLRFCAQARGFRGAEIGNRIDHAIRQCALGQMAHRPIHSLSRGYRQRTGLAQALLHSPRLLVLDEPTAGLDPAQIASMHALLKSLAAEGCAVLFSTHILSEAQAVADRVSVINRGRVLYDGALSAIAIASGRPRSLRIKLASQASGRLVDSLARLPGVSGKIQQVGDSEITVPLASDAAPSSGAMAFDAVRDAGLRATSISEDTITLEQAYLALIERDTRPVANASGMGKQAPGGST